MQPLFELVQYDQELLPFGQTEPAAKIGDRTVTRTAVLPAPLGTRELDSVLLAVALPKASRTCTCGPGVRFPPAVPLGGCRRKRSWLGAPGVTLNVLDVALVSPVGVLAESR